MSSGEPVDAAVKSRHADSVGEKYWDYRECAWVSYDAALEEIPEQATDEPVAVVEEADIVSG